MSNAPKRAGSAWERRVVDHAREYGLDWERAPLRGWSDLLDVEGCIKDGWLVGCKAISRSSNGNVTDKLGPAMVQGQRAIDNLTRMSGSEKWTQGIVPVQVIQRAGYETGRAYAVMEYDDFLRLAVERREWRQR